MSEEKIILGLFDVEGKLVIRIQDGIKLMDLVKAYGVLTVEVPFIVQNIKMQQMAKEKRIEIPRG